MELALALAQQAVAPLDRGPQRPLALREVDRSLHLQREPLVEGGEDLRRREHDEAGGDELDRQRQPVEAPADLAYGGERVLAEHDAAGRGELGEELGGVVDRERVERKDVLARKPQRDTARDEELHVGSSVEDLRHVPGRGGEMLEVVEHDERARSLERLADALDQRLARRLAHADRPTDRRGHEIGVGDRGEPDEMHGLPHRGDTGDLEREAALAGASGPRDGDEPDVRPGEECVDRRQVGAPPDEPVVERGERRPGERAERRELRREVVAGELEELLGLGDVLEAVATEGAERHARRRLVAGDVARRLRDDDLVPVPGRADAGCDVDVQADVPLLAELRLARVDADAHAEHALGRPGLPAELPLELRRRRDGVARAREGQERPVARPVDLVPGVPRRDLAHDLAHARANGGVALAERVQQARRALDVGEEERDGPAREPGRSVRVGHVRKRV